MAGIYAITHRESGRVYVGCSVDLSRRRRNHISALRRGNHCNTKLQRAWNKYGEQAFEFSTLIVCGAESLVMYEQLAIDAYGAVENGFNIAPVAGCLRGFKVVGRQMPPQSAEARRNKSIAASSRPSFAVREETKQKISAALKGRLKAPFTAEHLAKLSAAKLGRKMPDAHKAAIAAAHRARAASKCL